MAYRPLWKRLCQFRRYAAGHAVAPCGGDAPLGRSDRPGRTLGVPHWRLCDASAAPHRPRALHERQRGRPRAEAGAHLGADGSYAINRLVAPPCVTAPVTWCHIGRVDGRAALGHRHQLVQLEGKRSSGRCVRRDGKTADVARLPDGADAGDECAAARSVGVAVGRHLRPPSSRACRAAYMYHTEGGAGWCRVVLDDADFSAPARPDHTEVEVGDARAQRARA